VTLFFVGLEWVGREHMPFWPEPVHLGLFGPAVHMVASHPMYPSTDQVPLLPPG
jgi:hypothetical protein